MAYNRNVPVDNTVDIRENFRALKEDKIVAAATAISADTAVKLANARTISLIGDATGSGTFDGSVDMSITVDVNSADAAATCTGNAATSTKLETARTINGVPFDGSADITITQIDGKNIATSDQIPAASASVPVGGIIMWSGSNIPANWNLCNGTNGTPDLRGKFVLGYSTTYPIGKTGGEEKHQLTIDEIPSHNHLASSNMLSYQGMYTGELEFGGSDAYKATIGKVSATQYTGGNLPHNIMPPYYSLAYIMRIA